MRLAGAQMQPASLHVRPPCTPAAPTLYHALLALAQWQVSVSRDCSPHAGSPCAAGCIPVFLGPPYNSLPFPVDIDYRHASVFFNVTNTSAWLPEPVRWGQIGATAHARHPNDAVWWLPDIDVSDVAIPVSPLVSRPARVLAICLSLYSQPVRRAEHVLCVTVALCSAGSRSARSCYLPAQAGSQGVQGRACAPGHASWIRVPLCVLSFRYLWSCRSSRCFVTAKLLLLLLLLTSRTLTSRFPWPQTQP